VKPKAVAIITACLVLSGCGAATEREHEALAVSVAVVSVQDITREAKAMGIIVPGVEANRAFGVSGEVQEVLVTPGCSVEEGDVLASLDTSPMRAQVSQAEAAVAAARAAYSRAEKGPREQELEQVRAQVAQAEAAFNAAKSNYDRMKVLYDNRAISLQQLESSQVQLAAAEAAYTSALKQEEMALEGTPGEALEAAKAQLKQAEAAYDMAKTHLDNAVITAPFPGVVSYVNIREGEMAPAGTPAVGIVRLDPVFVELHAPESCVEQIKVGHTVEVTIRGSGNQRLGIVREVAPTADPRTHGFKVKVEVANPGGELKPGMFASVTLPRALAPGVVAIPRKAVISGAEDIVFVVEEGTARERRVVIGLDDGAMVEVKQGLTIGELVVIQGQHFLVDGMAVRVEEET